MFIYHKICLLHSIKDSFKNLVTCRRSSVSTLLTYVVQSTISAILLISLSFIGLYSLLAFRRCSLGSEAFANFISKSKDSLNSDAARTGSAPSNTATLEEENYKKYVSIRVDWWNLDIIILLRFFCVNKNLNYLLHVVIIMSNIFIIDTFDEIFSTHS